MSYVIEFRSGNYLQPMASSGPLETAVRFKSAEEAEQLMSGREWIALNGGMVIPEPATLARPVNLRREAYDVYIGRAGRGHDGYFGNPFQVARNCQRCGHFHADAQSTLSCYRSYFETKLATDPEFKRRVHELRGKRLGCFCKPGPCHGDIIAAYVNGLEVNR